MTDKEKLDKLVAEIKGLIGDYNIKTEKYRGMNEQAHQYYGGKRDALSEILKSIVPIQEEPKECMYSKDNYTDEDRKVLCEGCEEECEYDKSDDFTKALAECIHNAQCNVVDPMVFAEIWKDELIKLSKCEEPVSEELEEAVNAYIGYAPEVDESSSTYGKRQAFKAGAKWQKERILDCNTTLQRAFELGKQEMKQQMMAKAVDATVHIDAGGYPYIPQIELYDYDKDIPFAKEGDKYKVILIKEDRCMKANELMIGDWVMVNDIEHTHPLQVTELFMKSGTLYATLYWDGMPDNVNPEKLTTDVDKVLPIPLTTEILEKNGFENFDSYATLDTEKYKVIYAFDGFLTIVDDDNQRKVSYLECDCVHHFQHILRLCRIEKQIEL